MPDADDPPLELPDPDAVYRRYLETCGSIGIESVPHERAASLVQEWNERRSGRPDPTQH